jgi:hypothetical protein
MAASGIPDGRGDWFEPVGGSGEPAAKGGGGEPAAKGGGAEWASKGGGDAWASKDGGAADDARSGRVDYLQPLSNELIAAVLDGREYRYFTDNDGDIGGRWDDHLIYFFRFGSDGEMLQVRIMVKHTFTTADVPRLYAFCNEWNHDRLWPKAYVHVYDDGVVRVCGEVMADLTAGVAYNQLAQLIECGIETGLHMADAVAELRAA